MTTRTSVPSPSREVRHRESLAVLGRRRGEVGQAEAVDAHADVLLQRLEPRAVALELGELAMDFRVGLATKTPYPSLRPASTESDLEDEGQRRPKHVSKAKNRTRSPPRFLILKPAPRTR